MPLHTYSAAYAAPPVRGGAMFKNMKQKIALKINCPVCNTGNYFKLSHDSQLFECKDCTYSFSEKPKSILDVRSKCIFCNCSEFYIEGFPFLEKSLVCYLCEAEYKGVTIENSIKRFNQNKENKIRDSELAAIWYGRASKLS